MSRRYIGRNPLVMADGGASLELTEYSTDFAGVLRRRWPAVIAGPLVGIFVALAGLHVIPPGYTSTASVIVLATGDETTIANGRTSNPINLDTEAQIVTSAVVAKIAQQQLHSTEELRALTHHVTVTVPPNTTVLDISFSASTPAAAQRGADAFADAYLENRRSAAQAHLDGTVNTLEKRVATLNVDLRNLSDQIAVLPVNSPARAYKTARRTLLVQQIGSLNSQQVALISGDFQAGKIITDAQLPKVPSSPNKKLILASGLLVGILIGLVGAVLLDRRDHRIRTRSDLQRIGVPVLGKDVSLPAASSRREILLAPQGEELRRLRNALLSGLPDRRGAIVVAAVSNHSSGSAMATCLAVNAARTGAKVVLLLANLADPLIDKSLGLGDRAGLADVVQFDAKLENVVISVPEVPNLSLIPSGALASIGRRTGLSDILQGDTAGAVIGELRDTFDIVIVDAAPTTVTADAEMLASAADGVLIVATAKGTTREELIEAVDELDQVSVRLLGAVVVSTRSARGSDRKHAEASGSSGQGRASATKNADSEKTVVGQADAHRRVPSRRASQATAPPVAADRTRRSVGGPPQGGGVDESNMSVIAQVTAADVPRDARPQRRLRRGAPRLFALNPGWQLRLLLLGFPVLWALGLSGFAAPLLAIPMALELRRRRPLKLPRGFSLWLLFLFWSLAGLLVLGVNPSGTVTNTVGSRLFGYGLREVSYVTVTIILLFVGNLTEKELPQRLLVKWMGFFFVIATMGGLLGILMPNFQFTSPFELMLPHSLRSNIYVSHLVHPAAAQVQDLFGDPTPRPSAPFDYTNTWGFHMSLLAVWFVVDWFVGTSAMRRTIGVALLAVGGVTIALSLNRAAWIGVAISVGYFAYRLARNGRLLPLAGLFIGVVLAVVVLLASPLHNTLSQRLDNGQSNDIRALTSARAIQLAEQSPVIGYGSSRNAIGSGSTITVGRSTSCPQCGNPVIGSNGYIFMLLVSTGFVGTALFMAFGAVRLRRTGRDPTAIAVAGTLVLLLTAFYGFFYDVATWMTIPFISLGVLWRHDQMVSERREREAGEHAGR